MNNLSYNEALNQLKQHEFAMKVQKKLLKVSKGPELQRHVQELIRQNRNTINLLLSVIHAHKKARKLYGELTELRKNQRTF